MPFLFSPSNNAQLGNQVEAAGIWSLVYTGIPYSNSPKYNIAINNSLTVNGAYLTVDSSDNYYDHYINQSIPNEIATYDYKFALEEQNPITGAWTELSNVIMTSTGAQQLFYSNPNVLRVSLYKRLKNTNPVINLTSSNQPLSEAMIPKFFFSSNNG